MAPISSLSLSIGTTTCERAPASRAESGLFSSAAASTVIAIENTRLLNELRQRTEDLSESLQQQTATADVLKVISRSTFDLQAVLDTLVELAGHLCRADRVAIRLARDGLYHNVASHGFPTKHVAYMRSHPVAADRTSIVGRVVLAGKSVHIPDADADPELTLLQARGVERNRTVLGVPLLRDGKLIGVLVATRLNVETFTDKQIELLTTFADQAVIAIENVRLFDEVQARTRELSELLEQQTATSEVLQVISTSPGELQHVFEAMLANATRLCGAKFGNLNLYDGDEFCTVAHHNVPLAYAEAQPRRPFRPHPASGHAEVIKTKRAVHIEDVRAMPPYREGDPTLVALADLGGARTFVIVPMLKEAVLIGTSLSNPALHFADEARMNTTRRPADVVRRSAKALAGHGRARDAFRRETFALPREAAREKAREMFRRFPKAAYMTEIESWRLLPGDRIEFTMRRLPSAD